MDFDYNQSLIMIRTIFILIHLPHRESNHRLLMKHLKIVHLNIILFIEQQLTRDKISDIHKFSLNKFDDVGK
jgi:hypothetical protein